VGRAGAHRTDDRHVGDCGQGDYGAELASDSGFASVLSVLHETECAPGRHSLSVVALGRNGEATRIAGELLYLPQESAEEARVAPPEAQEKPRRRDPKRTFAGVREGRLERKEPRRPGAGRVESEVC